MYKIHFLLVLLSVHLESQTLLLLREDIHSKTRFYFHANNTCYFHWLDYTKLHIRSCQRNRISVMCVAIKTSKYKQTIKYFQSFFIHQLMHKWTELKTIIKFTLKFTLKQLWHISVQSHDHQGAHYSCLLKLQLLK